MSVVPANQSTALVVKLDDAALARIEGIVSQCNMAAMEGLGRVKQALLMAAGIAALEQLLTDKVMEDIMRLQGTKLGFRTDKSYPVGVVKQCLIEALLRGVWPVGNEFNIIANNSYITKEGFTRLLREYPGLTDLVLMPGVPRTTQSGNMIVPYAATWKIEGKPQKIEREIPVKLNSGMGVDAVLGKAERKIRSAIYNQITGSSLSDGDVDESNIVATIPAPKSLDQLTDKLNGKASEPTQAEKDLANAGDQTDEQGEIIEKVDWRETPLANFGSKFGAKLLSRFKTLKLVTIRQLMDALTAGTVTSDTADAQRIGDILAEIENEAAAELQQA